jgi:uncharacterized protein YkwD
MLKGNYVDLIILLILIYFVMEGFRHGFWVILVDFISFLSSILLSLWLYQYLAGFLISNFSLSHSVANPAAFLILAIATESAVSFLLAHLIGKIPAKLLKEKTLRFFSVLPALGEGLILTAFILTLAIAFPLKSEIKTDILNSRIGGVILARTTSVERGINEIFGGVIQETLTYLTVKPGSAETIPLKTASSKLNVDTESEAEMFTLVNSERIKLGIDPLKSDAKIVTVARNYATFLWENHYFGHVAPDGSDVGDRLKVAKIRYEFAGENLALAPKVTIAESGLMNSEGHRTNILDTRFKKVGIGVVDNGIYGKIFVQVFTN